MRRVAIALVLAVIGLAQPANAQTSITLAADPSPIVAAEINGRPIRLEVDLRMPSGLALSNTSAERLRVRRVPFVAISIGIEGGATIRGRLSRPRLQFEGEDSRAFAGIFPAPVTDRADGVIGPGALPYDIITITLGPDQPSTRDIVFPLEDADNWVTEAQVGGETVKIGFDLTHSASVFNRTASRRFDSSGAIVSNGELAEQSMILGLRTLMQPVDTQLSVSGLALAPAYARTNAPLLGVESETIVVHADADERTPGLTIGRQALAHCVSISVNRRTKQLTLRCAG
jgi:hypothetical protein